MSGLDLKRPSIPPFISDLYADRTALNGLIVGSAALFASALDPKVWGPSLPSVQAAIAESPQLEALSLLAMLGGSALVLLGGALGDSVRAKPIIAGGLAVELIAALISMLVPSGPVLLASRFIGHAAAAFIIPASLALVATSYNGITRATAIGLAYAGFGAAGALAPVLLKLDLTGWTPAFLGAIVACAIALVIVRGRIPELVRPSLPERVYVVRTAVWAFGIITVTVGVTWIGTPFGNPLRWGLVLAGLAILGLAILHDRRTRRAGAGEVHIDQRPVAIAVIVGVILGIANTAPMMLLPRYFQLILSYGPLLATAALAPLFAALILAGPAAGFLLSRWSPRRLIGVGTIAVGAGDLLLALIATPSAGYLLFIIPCLAIGAGFVLATTVRTAIIFASVSRGLPATAAALNEASAAVGARIGVVIVTATVGQVAIATYTASVSGLPVAEAQQAVTAFQGVLSAIGLPSFNEVAAAIDPSNIAPYVEAYSTGIRAALALSGATAVIGGLIGWLALGRRDPLTTVWEHSEEREAAPA